MLQLILFWTTREELPRISNHIFIKKKNKRVLQIIQINKLYLNDPLQQTVLKTHKNSKERVVPFFRSRTGEKRTW